METPPAPPHRSMMLFAQSGGEVFNDQWWSLAISVAIWVPVTALVFAGGFVGTRKHAMPRYLYALGSAVLSCLYFADLVNWIPHAKFGQWARGVGWYMGICLGWIAWTGIVYGREMQRVFQHMEAKLANAETKD